MTQGQLAEFLGISPQHMASLEKGIRKVPASILPTLARLFSTVTAHKTEVCQRDARYCYSASCTLIGRITMQNAKQEAIDAIQRLPDSADTEEMMYRLYVLENVRRGQLDADNGNTESTEALESDDVPRQ